MDKDSIQKFTELIKELWYNEVPTHERKIKLATGKAGAIAYLLSIYEKYGDETKMKIEDYKKDLEENMMEGYYEIDGLGIRFNKGSGRYYVEENGLYWEKSFNESGYIFNKKGLSKKQFDQIRDKLQKLKDEKS